MLDKLTEESFSPFLHQKFQIRCDFADPFEAELMETKAMGEGASDTKRRPFSVVLRGPEQQEPMQGLYRITHEKMGTMELFLVPFGSDDEGMLYEAVFT